MRIETWKNTILKNYLYKEAAPQEEIDHIIDFLKRNPDLNITRLSYPDAKLKAEQWTINLNKKNQNLKNAGIVNEIMTFEDGYHFVLLKDKVSYEWEGTKMGHCVASYYPSRSMIYSLRDSDEIPHCTIETTQNQIVQIKGKANKEVVDKYSDKVISFLKYINLGLNIHYDGERFLRQRGFVQVKEFLLNFCKKHEINLDVLEFKNSKFYKLPSSITLDINLLKQENKALLNNVFIQLIKTFGIKQNVSIIKYLFNIAIDELNDSSIIPSLLDELIELDDDQLILKCFPLLAQDFQQVFINSSIQKDNFALFKEFYNLNEKVLSEASRKTICNYGSNDILDFLIKNSTNQEITEIYASILGNMKKARIIFKNNPTIDYTNPQLIQRFFQLGIWSCVEKITPDLRRMLSSKEAEPFFKKYFNEKVFTVYNEAKIPFPCSLDDISLICVDRVRKVLPIIMKMGGKLPVDKNYDDLLVRIVSSTASLSEDDIFLTAKSMLELGANPHYSNYGALSNATANGLEKTRNLILEYINKVPAPSLVAKVHTQSNSFENYELEIIKIFAKKVFNE